MLKLGQTTDVAQPFMQCHCETTQAEAGQLGEASGKPAANAFKAQLPEAANDCKGRTSAELCVNDAAVAELQGGQA
jgi:hypothetical protein